MAKIEKLEDFYQRKLIGVPDAIRKELGYFNVFRLDPFVGSNATPVPYKKRDYYKITLVVGSGRVHYADRVIEVGKQALTFTNPQIPYAWENTDRIRSGFFCIFTRQLFHQFASLDQYAVYQPSGTPVFELTNDQAKKVTAIYERMFEEFHSDYLHKYDILRTLILELIHMALKMQPSSAFEQQPLNAAKRITTLFLELLERQFPIDDTHQRMELRTAADFAQQLAVHVNHLNSALKTTTDKTTTQLIAERVLQESKVLLRQSNWSVSEIAFALGFNEVTHFSNFFKKLANMSPVKFRNSAGSAQ